MHKSTVVIKPVNSTKTSQLALLGCRCARSHSSTTGRDYNGKINCETPAHCGGRYMTWHPGNVILAVASLLGSVWRQLAGCSLLLLARYAHTRFHCFEVSSKGRCVQTKKSLKNFFRAHTTEYVTVTFHESCRSPSIYHILPILEFFWPVPRQRRGL